MIRYVLNRLRSLFISLIFSSLVIFVMIEGVPGDAASFMLGINASEDTVKALKQELGLDENLITRYFQWSYGMLTGDFGISYTYRVPVKDLVIERVSLSAPLAIYALAIAIAISFPAGFFAAKHCGKKSDYFIMGLAQLGIAIPNFWFGMLLVLIFSINLNWFSAGGFPGWESGFFIGMQSLTLPAIALALPQAAILSRILRSALIDTLQEDYIRTARAKGLNFSQAILRHAMKNALIPVLTIMGLQFSFLLAGAIIIENIFFLPGLGRLIFQGITQRDLIVVESVVMILVFSVILVNFLVDVAYAIIDPRVRLE